VSLQQSASERERKRLEAQQSASELERKRREAHAKIIADMEDEPDFSLGIVNHESDISANSNNGGANRERSAHHDGSSLLINGEPPRRICATDILCVYRIGHNAKACNDYSCKSKYFHRKSGPGGADGWASWTKDEVAAAVFMLNFGEEQENILDHVSIDSSLASSTCFL